ncbi:hypothetical protein JCM17823_04450 [Halorubrum gandharaense]
MHTSVLAVGDDAFPFHRFEKLGPVIADAVAGSHTDVTLTTDAGRLADLDNADYDAVLDYRTDSTMTDAARDGLCSFVAAGGGYAGVHCASDLTTTVDGVRDDPEPQLRDLIGGHFTGHPEQTTFGVAVVDTHHPVTAGLSRFEVFDEPYGISLGDDARVLARLDHPTQGDTPAVWVKPYDEGRVFYCSLGHDVPALTAEPVRTLLSRGVAWAADADA